MARRYSNPAAEDRFKGDRETWSISGLAVSNGGEEIDLPFERVKQRDSCNLKVDMEIQSARGIFTNIDQLYTIPVVK